MNNLEFIKRIQHFFDECILEIKRKNPDYAHQGVPLYDMFHTAFEENVPPETVLRVLLTKHWSAVRAWSSGKTLSSETIEGRLTDSANYIGFLAMLSAEEGPALVQAILDEARRTGDNAFFNWMYSFRAFAFKLI
jgi:hypothetical protein